MSRTYRNTKKGSKNLTKSAISRHFSFSYINEGRRLKEDKGGAIILEEDRIYMLKFVLFGIHSQGVPKAWRKVYNQHQKVKMKKELKRKIQLGEFDDIYCGKMIRNAGYHYY